MGGAESAQIAARLLRESHTTVMVFEAFCGKPGMFKLIVKIGGKAVSARTSWREQSTKSNTRLMP